MAIRVFQIAKDYNRSTDEILKILSEGGVKLKSHTSELDEHARHVLRTSLHKFKLTVVDNEAGSLEPIAVEETSPPTPPTVKSGKGKSKKTKAPAKVVRPMSVRIIKKQAPEPEKEESVSSEQAEQKFADDGHGQSEARHPRLKRPRPRSNNLQDRISQKIHNKLSAKPTDGSTERPSTTGAVPGSAPEKTLTKGASFKPKPNDRAPRAARDSGQQNYRDQRSGGGSNYDRNRNDRPGGGQRPSGGGQRPSGGGQRPSGGGQRPSGGGQRPGYTGSRGQQGGTGQARPGGYQGRRNDSNRNRPPQRSGTSMALSFKIAQGGTGGPSRAAAPGGGPVADFGKAPARAPSRYTAMGSRPGPGNKKKKKKRRNQENTQKLKHMPPAVSKLILPDEDLGIVMLPDGVTVKVLAEKVNRMAKDIIKRLFENGVFATINDVLDDDLAVEIAKDFGYLAEIIPVEEVLQMEDEEMLDQDDSGGEKVKRAPIVTILGHVDHGKTSLLDYIRATRVAEGESGGITQHIGAYEVVCKDEPIVFLDTPGHEAFTKMRARGTSVTDIVILVVAADDGVMPQTIEAINHAKAAKVPIIVAINKIDKPEANPDRVKQMMTEHELIVEEYGGDVPCVLCSAKTGEGISDLLEMILLVSEMHSYQAVPQKRGIGSVIEAKLERGRGAVATVLVQDGTIHVGDSFITGQTFGKIRAIYSDLGVKVQEVGPSTPVEILGCQDVPMAGDSFMVVASEVKAREISSFRKERAREEQLKRQKNASLDQLFSSIQKDEVAELSLILKADVQGSTEGLVHALEGIKSDKVDLRIIHQGVGGITENDVLLASASKAIIIGFRVRAERPAHALAEREVVEIRYYNVIYEAIQDVKAAMLGLVPPEYKEVILGRASVRQVFQIPKIGNIAGSNIDDGKVTKNAKARVIRQGKVIFDGEIDTLKRFKDDVNEVKAGYECGIGMLGFDDYAENDQFEIYIMEAVRPTSLS